MTSPAPSGAGPDQVFVALADGTRRELLRSIVDDGPQTATQLAAARDISRQAVAKHLSVLGDAGLVTGHRAGREVRYDADPTPLASATEWIRDTSDSWDRRLGRLQELMRSRGGQD